jgi:hypothetical protein
MEAVVADFRHGLALWPGSREQAEEHHRCLGLSCKELDAADDFDKHVRVLVVGKHVDQTEMDQMAKTSRVPKRVQARFGRGDFG